MPIVKINNISVSYEVQGKGNPLVLIAGLGGGKSGWRYHSKFLKKYYQVITFDNRGAGESEKPKGPYSIKQMADDTVALMDHLGIRQAHILGVSMGGTVAQEVAINYPERTLKLILGCTYASHDATNGRTPEWDNAINAFIKNGTTPSITLVLNKPLYRILGFFLVKRQYSGMNESAKAGFAAQSEAAIKHNTLDRLPFIKAPTLVLVGTGDKAIRPSSSRTLARLIPNAKLVEINNGSHGFSMENRGKFSQEVFNFLKND